MTGEDISARSQPAAGRWTAVFDWLWWPLILLALVSTCFIGSIGSIGSVVCGVLCMPILFDREARRELSGEWGILVFPAFFAVLAIIFALHADEWSDMVYIFNFTALPLAMPVYVLARRHAGGNWPLIIISLAFAGAVLGTLIGLWQVYSDGMNRAQGLFNNPNMYAHIILILGFMSVTGLFLTTSRWRILFATGPLFALAGTIMSGSRGTMIVLPVAAVLALAYVLIQPHSKRWLFGFLALLIGAVAVWLAYFAQFQGGLARIAGVVATTLEVLRTGESGEIGTQARLAVYFGAWQAWLQSPIIGYGWADAIPAVTEYVLRPRVKALASTFPHMHSDWLGFAVGAGVFGLIGFFAMMAAPLYALRHFDALFWHRAYLVSLLIASYAIYGIFDAMFGFDTGISTYVILTAIFAGTFSGPRTGHTTA